MLTAKKIFHWVVGIGIILISIGIAGLGCSFGCNSIIPFILPLAIMSIPAVIFIYLGYIPSKNLWIWFFVTLIIGVIYSKIKF